MASPETGTTPSATADQQQPKPPSWEYQLREYLLLLSSVVAIATYSAGLAPPGGVRQEDHDVAGGGGQYKAGDPILQDIAAAGSAAHARYLAFYYCNATAFAASLVVNLLLLVLKEASTVGLATLRTVMVLDVLALMAAYAAGSCRDLLSTVFVSTLVVGLSAYLAIKIIYQTRRNSSATTTTAPAGDDDDNELRKVLMLLATFATEITYTAGLSPPGGFQDDGDPTLRSAGQSKRLMAFFYCNTAAFVASLSIVVPLLSSRLQRMYLELYPPILVALLGLMGAYTAGSSRDLRTIAYVVALVAAVLAYILLVMAIALKKKHDVDLPGGEKDSETASPRNEKMGQLEGEKGSKNNELMKDNDFVLLLATLAASITYQAGLDPPGGVWSMDDELYGHKAGDPILLSTHAKRYKAFFYCNSTAFAASLVVILMVQSSKIVKGKALVIATMILDLFGLIGAYAAGSCRDVSTSIYVIALAGAVLVYVVIHVVFWPDNCYVSNQKDKVLEKRRERLLLLAILVATIAYQAGLTPPGGFWDKDDAESGHRAGVPVLLDNYPRRYHAFFYCNATAFMASVALIILLVNPKLYNLGIRCYALYVCMMVGLFGLMGAYAAGSARRVQTSIYVFVLVGVVIAFLLVQLVYFNIRAVWKQLLVFLNIKKEPATSNSDSAIIIRGSSSGSEQHTASNTEEESKKKEYLMTLAILAASVTYQAGLNPPGSVWQDGWNMGNPVMRDSNHHRYNAFFYCNSTSFMASIIVIILLLQQYQKKHIYAGFLLYAMNMVIVVDLLGLLGAYAAGSCRDWETSGYVIALAVVVLASIMIHFTLWYYNGRSKGRVVEVEEISTLPVNHS